MRRTLIPAIALLWATLLGICSHTASPQSGVSSNKPVGFKIIERLDATRASKSFPNGRPIQIAYWYPAASVPAAAVPPAPVPAAPVPAPAAPSASASPEIAPAPSESAPAAPQVATSPALTYRDYVLLSARETVFGTPNEAAGRAAVEQYKAFLSSAGVKPEEADALLSTKMQAVAGAAALRGRFPLVLIAQGNGQSAQDQAFLAELLAARGYAVATVPSQARIGGKMTSEQEIPDQAEDQAADLAFALRTVRFESEVRPGKYGVVAHSFGARSALLLAMQDSDVAALVSLDGGIGGKTGKGQLEKAKSFRRARATAPILHFYEEGDRQMIPDLDLIRSLDRADRWLVKVDGMLHVHFSSAGVLIRTVPALAKATSADQHTAAAWDVVAGATASFLDHFIAEANSSRRPTAAWMPPESPLLHTTHLAASTATPGKPASAAKPAKR